MNSPRAVVNSDNRNPKSNVCFRQARFDDHAQISQLQARYGLETDTYEAWLHLWSGNPAAENLTQWPIGWVLQDEDASIVGYLGNLRRLYEIENRPVVVASTRGLVVDIAHRSHSLPLLSHFFNQRQVDLFLDTTVSAGALKAHEIFRALRTPSGVWDEGSFWITNYGGFSGSFLTRKEIRGAAALRHPLSAGLLLRDVLEGRSFKTRRNGVEPAFCDQFDGRFDGFWQQLRKSYPRRLLANRSSAMLNWHFRHPLGQNRAWVLTSGNGGSLSAYAVFLRQDNPGYGLTRMRLVDFQALEGCTELLAPILCHALARCRKEGIHMLETIGFAPDKQRIIDSLSPHRRSLSCWRYFYKTTTRELAEELKDPKVWDPTCFDGDASL